MPSRNATQPVVRLTLFGCLYEFDNEFVEWHPGGSHILRQAEMMTEAGPLFKSYHSLSIQKQWIESQLRHKYLSGIKTKEISLYTFANGGFYDVVSCRVKNLLIKEKIRNFKAPFSYWVKVVVIFYAYLTFLNLSFFVSSEKTFTSFQLQLVKFLSAFIAGLISKSLTAKVLHEASHFTLGKSPLLNRGLCKLNASLIFWGYEQWMYHHTILHHAFTGHSFLDPDMHWLIIKEGSKTRRVFRYLRLDWFPKVRQNWDS